MHRGVDLEFEYLRENSRKLEIPLGPRKSRLMAKLEVENLVRLSLYVTSFCLPSPEFGDGLYKNVNQENPGQLVVDHCRKHLRDQA